MILLAENEAENVIRVVNVVEEEIPDIKPIKYGRFYVYDVDFEEVGNRILVMPAPWDRTFKFIRSEVFRGGLFVNALGAKCWLRHIGWAFSPRAGRIVPIFFVMMSDWYVANNVTVREFYEEKVINRQYLKELVAKIDYYFSQELLHKYLEAERNVKSYKEQLENMEKNVDEIAEDRAALLTQRYLRSQRAIGRLLEEKEGEELSKKDKIMLAVAGVLGLLLFLAIIL